MLVSWQASDADGAGVSYYSVDVREVCRRREGKRRRRATGSSIVDRTALTGVHFRGDSGSAYEFRITAVDRAGQPDRRSRPTRWCCPSTTATAASGSCRAAGSASARRRPGAAPSCAPRSAGATATLRFTGRSVSLIGRKLANGGRLRVTRRRQVAHARVCAAASDAAQLCCGRARGCEPARTCCASARWAAGPSSWTRWRRGREAGRCSSRACWPSGWGRPPRRPRPRSASWSSSATAAPSRRPSPRARRRCASAAAAARRARARRSPRSFAASPAGCACTTSAAARAAPRDGGGLFVESIRGDANRGQNGWVYKVGRRAATAGAADPGGPVRARPAARGPARHLVLLPPARRRLPAHARAEAPRRGGRAAGDGARLRRRGQGRGRRGRDGRARAGESAQTDASGSARLSPAGGQLPVVATQGRAGALVRGARRGAVRRARGAARRRAAARRLRVGPGEEHEGGAVVRVTRDFGHNELGSATHEDAARGPDGDAPD